MIIQVNSEWRIDSSDKQNYSLCQRTVVEKGKRAGQIDWAAEGYYSSPAAALYALVKRAVITSEQVVDVKSFIQLYKQIAETFERRIPAKQAEEMLKNMDRAGVLKVPAGAEIVMPEGGGGGFVAKPKRMPSKA